MKCRNFLTIHNIFAFTLFCSVAFLAFGCFNSTIRKQPTSPNPPIPKAKSEENHSRLAKVKKPEVRSSKKDNTNTLEVDNRQESEETPVKLPDLPNIEPKLIVGDRIRISVDVGEENEISRQHIVPANGTINYPLIGEINLLNKTLQQVREELSVRLSKYYVSPMVTVASMTWEPRKVYIYSDERGSQAVNLPINKLPLASHILLSSGISPKMDLSQIYIVRKKNNQQKQIINIPLQRILKDYKLEDDIVLQPGDMVHIKPGDRVYLQGNVARRGAFPIPKYEKLSLWKLISLAQGPIGDADLENVRIIRKVGENKRIIKKVSAFTKSESEAVFLKAGDIVIVPSRSENVVTLFGEVRRAGSIPISGKKARLSRVIAKAGGLTQFASDEIQVFRYLPNGEIQKFVANFSDLTDGTQDMEVQVGDVIYVDSSIL